MKKILLILLMIVPLLVGAQSKYYVATNGNDNNPGTIESPWATWNKGFASASPGDTVFIRGGEYISIGTVEINPIAWPNPIGKTGTRANPITIMSYPGEWAVLNCENHCEIYKDYAYGNFFNSAIILNQVEHIVLKNFEVKNVFQCDPVVTGGIAASDSRNITFEHIILHDVAQRGYWMEGGAFLSYNEDGYTNLVPHWPTIIDTTRWINCDVYNLFDNLSSSPGNAADAWKTIHYRGNHLLWEGCRAWNYSDDGWDPTAQNGATRELRNCWAMPTNKYQDPANGWITERNAFKFTGPGVDYPTVTMTNCLAMFCKMGFYEIYANHTSGRYYNNTAYSTDIGFAGSGTSGEFSIYRNNISYIARDKEAGEGKPFLVALPSDYTESNNTWNKVEGYPWFAVSNAVTVSDDDFVTTDSLALVALFTAPRQADGSLPKNRPLQLKSSSDLINKGVSVGLPYAGAAPDIGYVEYTDSNIIADHTIVDDFDIIPQVYINEVKKMWASYAGESHSEGIRAGLQMVENLDNKFAVNIRESGSPDPYTTSSLRFSRATWGDVDNASGWVYGYGEEDWFTSTNAIDRTKAGLAYINANEPKLAAFGFGWCWDNGVNFTDYVNATIEYIDYCNTQNIDTKVFFTTGTVDEYDGEQGYIKHLGYEQIRTAVRSNNSRILFDYADILCHDNSGNLTTTTWNGNTYPFIANSNYMPTVASYHISEAGALRLGKAMWWMLARMAGWDGLSESAIPNAPPTASFTATPTTINEGESIALNASSSSDSDGTITSYAWNFGNGTGTGVTTSRTYATAGTYNVTLTVTDNDGNSTSTSRTVIVNTVQTGLITNTSELITAMGIAQPGDILYLSSNTFIGAVNFNTNGTSSNPIVIQPAATFTPVFSGSVTVTGSHVTLTGLTFSGGVELTSFDTDLIYCNINSTLNLNRCTSPTVTNNTFTGNGTVISISFPFGDYIGRNWNLNNNTYNISPNAQFNGLNRSEWRMKYDRFDANSIFNIN